mgnify:CR=1 FL=1
MKVTARVYATLKRYLPEEQANNDVEFELPAGTTVRELIENFLKIPPEAVKVVFVNGKHADMDQVLNDGDRVGVFPPVAGG